MQKDNYLYEKCEILIYNCKWKATPIDESIRAYKGLQHGLDRQVDVRIWLEVEGKNGYYFTAKNGTITIIVLPRLSLLLYAAGDEDRLTALSSYMEYTNIARILT